MNTPAEHAPPALDRTVRASLILVVVTLLWGMSFPWTKSWQEARGPASELLSSLTLIALRMPLALLLLGLWQPGVVLRPTRHEHLGGAALGTVFFAGFALQTWGLASTTPALSAFFTSLCSAWVPLIALVFLGQKVVPLTLAGLMVGLAGCAVMVEGGWKLGKGEWLTLIASVLFAVQMLVLDALGRRLEPAHLTAGFLAVTGVGAWIGALVLAVTGPGLVAWGGWTREMLTRPDILRSLACLVVLPTVLGFHWMNTYQPVVSPSRAALIYLLEPVFSSVFSVWWKYDELALPLVLGGTLILVGNLLVEVPRWLSAVRVAR